MLHWHTDASTSRQIIEGFRRQKQTSLCGSTGLQREGKSEDRIVAPFHLLSISHTRYFIRARSKRKGTLAPRAFPQTLIIACRKDANRERGGGLYPGSRRWLKGVGRPLSFFSPREMCIFMYWHSSSFVGRRDIIWISLPNIYFMVLQTDAVTDRSAARSERHARSFIKFRRRWEEKQRERERNREKSAMGFPALSRLVPQISRAHVDLEYVRTRPTAHIALEFDAWN